MARTRILICIGVYLLSLGFTYKCTRARVCARVYPHSEGDFRGSWLRVNTHIHASPRPQPCTQRTLRVGWRQKAFVARSTCLCGSFPAKLSVAEQQSSRLAELLPRTGGAARLAAPRAFSPLYGSILRKPHK